MLETVVLPNIFFKPMILFSGFIYEYKVKKSYIYLKYDYLIHLTNAF